MTGIQMPSTPAAPRSELVLASIKDIAAPLDFEVPLGFDIQIEPRGDSGSTIRFAVNHAIHDQGQLAVPAPRGIRAHGTAGSPEQLVAALLRAVQYAYAGTSHE